MGQTLKSLSKTELSNPSIFHNRFVVESCEDFHFHYGELRIRLSYADFAQLGKGFSDAYLRWEKQGRPAGGHTELCRKRIRTLPKNDGIQVNLNKNLYKENEGRVFSEGAGLTDPDYIHLKIRDLRIELTREEFAKLAECVGKAKEELGA